MTQSSSEISPEAPRIGSQALITKYTTNMSQVAHSLTSGYTGHVPGIVAENLFAKSYAKTTASALHGEFSRGYDLPLKARYRS